MPEDTPILSVDLSPILTANEDDEEVWKSVAQELGKGFHDIGAVYLVNHGIDLDLVEKVFAKTKALFELPMETKRSYLKKNAVGDFSGFTEAGTELLNDDSKFEMRESYDVMITDPKYPKEIPGFDETIQTTIDVLTNLETKMFKLMALALDIDVQFFLDSSHYRNNKDLRSWTVFRVQKYPSVPEGTVITKGTARCAAHTDWDVITFLFQDSVGGLEMKTREGDWVHVTPVPGSIVLNVGEILEVWTRGYFPAVEHRVLLSEEEQRIRKDRYSLAFFTFPDDHAPVCPLEKNKILTDDFEYKENMTSKAHVEDHVIRSRGYS